MPDRNSFFDRGYLLTIQMRERAVLRALELRGFADLRRARILEVGTGAGNWLRDLVRWGADPANLFGVEIDPARAALARRLCPGAVTIECGDARALAHPDRSFDIVLQSTLFSSVLNPADRRRIAAEMLRVLRPSGMLLWYDLRVNNPRNPRISKVTGREIRRLFPGCAVALRRITLAPPIARRLARGNWLLSVFLSGIAPATTHLLGVIQARP